MNGISVTGEFGIIVRRSSLGERGVDFSTLLKILEAEFPLDIDEGLISFGPCFGQEALDQIVVDLSKIGLVYFDDFFEFVGDFPDWCKFKATLGCAR